MATRITIGKNPDDDSEKHTESPLTQWALDTSPAAGDADPPKTADDTAGETNK